MYVDGAVMFNSVRLCAVIEQGGAKFKYLIAFYISLSVIIIMHESEFITLTYIVLFKILICKVAAAVT